MGAEHEDRRGTGGGAGTRSGAGDGDGKSWLLGQGDRRDILHRQRAGGGGGCRGGAAGAEEAEDGIRGVEHGLLRPRACRKISRVVALVGAGAGCMPASPEAGSVPERAENPDGRAELSYSSLKDKDTGIGRRRRSAVGTSDLGAKVAPA